MASTPATPDLAIQSETPPAKGRPLHAGAQSNLAGLGLAALGIVFGDIGTSPLYTLKTVLQLAGGAPRPAEVLGVLSLVVWTLVIVTTIKYVSFAMRIDNDGEGGILALMSLIGTGRQRRAWIVAVGLFGAALIYGDGAVTPAISVMSAIEGLTMMSPAVQPYVLPASVIILLALFAAQPLGTASIGKAFGPIMTLWFLSIAILGVMGIVHHPGVLAAVNPLLGLGFLAGGGLKGFLVLGGIFLCVTGAEALYADMGHFGAKPIRLAWLGVVFPSLLLNYAGQSAIVLDGAKTDGNIFYQLCPGPLLIPFVILATMATVIASQSIITGAFSMTRQAIQLGWLPRLTVKQTSAEGYGQIYVGGVNWILMAVTLALTVGFGKSDRLASAYGIAVSLTMLMTTVLLFIAMRAIWRWSLPAAGSVAACFLIVDAAFFGANLVKIADGGYVPLLLAGAVYGIMWIWHRGSVALARRIAEDLMSVDAFTAEALARQVPRVPGTAVFLTRTDRDVPPLLALHLKHNRALHRQLLVLTVRMASVPWIAEAKRLEIHALAPDVWRADATYGFMERPDIPAVLAAADHHGCGFDLHDVTYYVGHATIVPREDGKGLPRWQEALFAIMERNSSHVSDVLRLPRDQTVELGRQIPI